MFTGAVSHPTPLLGGCCTPQPPRFAGKASPGRAFASPRASERSLLPAEALRDAERRSRAPVSDDALGWKEPPPRTGYNFLEFKATAALPVLWAAGHTDRLAQRHTDRLAQLPAGQLLVFLLTVINLKMQICFLVFLPISCKSAGLQPLRSRPSSSSRPAGSALQAFPHRTQPLGTLTVTPSLCRRSLSSPESSEQGTNDVQRQGQAEATRAQSVVTPGGCRDTGGAVTPRAAGSGRDWLLEPQPREPTLCLSFRARLG